MSGLKNHLEELSGIKRKSIRTFAGLKSGLDQLKKRFIKYKKDLICKCIVLQMVRIGQKKSGLVKTVLSLRQD